MPTDLVRWGNVPDDDGEQEEDEWDRPPTDPRPGPVHDPRATSLRGTQSEDNKECANILPHTKSACREKVLKECVPLEDPRAATLAIYRHARAPWARTDSVLWSWRRDSNP